MKDLSFKRWIYPITMLLVGEHLAGRVLVPGSGWGSMSKYPRQPMTSARASTGLPPGRRRVQGSHPSREWNRSTKPSLKQQPQLESSFPKILLRWKRAREAVSYCGLVHCFQKGLFRPRMVKKTPAQAWSEWQHAMTHAYIGATTIQLMDLAPGLHLPAGPPRRSWTISSYLKIDAEDATFIATVSEEQYRRYIKCTGEDPDQIHQSESWFLPGWRSMCIVSVQLLQPQFIQPYQFHVHSTLY